MEREIEGLKALQIEVARTNLLVSSLSDKIDALDKKFENRCNSLEKNLSDKIDGIDRRLSRFETGIVTFVAVVLSRAFSVLVFSLLKMMYF
ncbi:MAG: hypothetical protein JOZ78_17460 [Chroococcidiopsidaceae cyanobacterium CP_BM_ER_R8_30]|nr:hypothetical protein [Chroococcidiopsidaceae cyanobacterium CP_BM_ER_R8_30]